MTVNTRNRGFSYLLCFLLAFPAHLLPISGYGRVIEPPPAAQSEYPFRQLVIYIPDIFDSAKEIDKALSRLRAKGIPARDIINLAQHPDFDLKSGLAAQAEQLARITEVESAKRRGLKAHLIAKGTGGLAARSYLAAAREIRPEGAPVIDVICIGVPHNGRLWAKWAYSLALPLPEAGVRSAAVRDLSPDSRFMRKLNYLKKKREKMVRRAESTLKNLDDFSFKQALKAKLAAIDHAKSASAEQVDRFFNSPESIHLSPGDRQRIHDMKNSYQALKIVCGKFGDALAEKPGVNALASLGNSLNREHAKICRKIEIQTRKPADWLERSALSQKLSKIKELTGVIEAGNDQAQNRLLDLFRSPGLCQLSMVSEYPKNRFLSAIAGKLRKLEEISSQDKHKNAWDEFDRFYFRTAPKLKKQWDSFNANSVTASREHSAHKPGSNFSQAIGKLEKLQQQYLSLARLQTTWDAMEESRHKWLAGLRQYAEAESYMSLRHGFQAYQKNLEHQLRQLEKMPTADFATARQILDKTGQVLAPALDELLHIQNMPALTGAVQTGYQALKTRQKFFLEAAEHTKEYFSSRIVKNEYLLYLERANHLDQLVMDKIPHGPEEAQQAVIALEKGSAVKEMEMFAQASRRRLDREFGNLYHQMDVLPSFETLFPHEPARTLNKILNKIKQGADNYKSLRDLDYLKAKSGLFKSHLQKQTREAKRILAACDVVQALEKTGHAEQYMKMICARSAEDLKRKVLQTDFAAELSQLSQERRNLVIAVLNITGQVFAQIKAFDLTRFAARLEAFGQLPSAGPVLWKLAKQRINIYTDVNAALHLCRNSVKMKLAEQAARDAVWDYLNKAIQLEKARKHISNAAGVKQTMTRLREKEDLLQQINLRIERLSALQAKTLPSSRDFRLSDWRNLRTRIEAGIKQEKETLFSQKALLAKSSAKVSAFLPKSWDIHEVSARIRSLEDVLMRNPALPALTRLGALKQELNHRYDLYSGETLELIMGHKFPEYIKSLAIKERRIKQTLKNCIKTAKSAVLSGEIRLQLHELRGTQTGAAHYLNANMHLLRQQVLQTRLMQQFDKPADDEAHIPSDMADRIRITAALDLINIEIAAQLMRAGLKFHAARFESIAKRSQARVKIRQPDMDRQSGRELMNTLIHINKLAAKAAQDVGDIIKDINFASAANDISRALARAKDQSARAARELTNGRAPPDWDIAETRRAMSLQKIYGNAITHTVNFIRQQAIRTELQHTLDQAAILGNEARSLLYRQILEIDNNLAGFIFAESQPAMPLPSTSNLTLGKSSEQISLSVSRSQIFRELDKLRNLKDHLTAGLERQLLEIRRADAALVMKVIAGKYQTLGKDFQEAWEKITCQLTPGNRALDPAFNFANPEQFKIDRELLQTLQQDVFARLVEIYPILAEGFSNFGDNLAGSLKDFITSACNIDLGAVFINFTLTPGQFFTKAGDMISGFIADSFEFRFNSSGSWFQADQVWDTAADIFNSGNWKFDFFRAADGFMQSISDGLSSLADRGLEWAQNCWQEYLGQAQEYLDIFAGGPPRWLEELTGGKWADSIHGLIDEFLPPEFQPAKSALEKIYFAFDADFDFSVDYVFSVLDDLSAYLSDDLPGIYEDISNIYEQGQEHSQRGQEAWEAVQSGDLTSLAVMGSRLLGSLKNPGPVYVLGNGLAREKGGCANQTGQTYQNRMDDYLSQPGPGLHGLQDVSGAVADSGIRSRSLSDLSLFPPLEKGGRGDLLEKPDLSPPRGNIPMPPGKGHWEIDPSTGRNSLLSRVGGALKEGAKTWADPRRWGPKAEKVNKTLGRGAPEKAEHLRKTAHQIGDITKAGIKSALNFMKKGAAKFTNPKEFIKTTKDISRWGLNKAGQIGKNIGKKGGENFNNAGIFWKNPGKFKNGLKYWKERTLNTAYKLDLDYGKTGVIDGTKFGLCVGYMTKIKLGRLGRLKTGCTQSILKEVIDGEFIFKKETYIGGELEFLGVGVKIAKENGEYEFDFYWSKDFVEVNKDAIEIGGTFIFPGTPIGVTGEAHIHLDKLLKKAIMPFRRRRNEKNNSKNNDTESNHRELNFYFFTDISFRQSEKYYVS